MTVVLSPNQSLVSQRDSLLFGLKQRSREFRLANDTQQRAAPDRIMKRTNFAFSLRG